MPWRRDGYAVTVVPALVEGGTDRGVERQHLRGERKAGSGDHVLLGVDDGDGPAERRRERLGHRPETAAGEHGLHELLVHGVRAVTLDEVSGQALERAAGGVFGDLQVAQGLRRLQDDGGVVGERRQQRDLVRGELLLLAVADEQHAEHVIAAEHGHPEKGDEALCRDGVVDPRVVVAVGVGGVVGGPLGCA